MITERYVLMEALDMALSMQDRFSRNGRYVHGAKPGYEKAFDEEGKKVEILRKMIYEIDRRKVKVNA